MSSKKTKKNVLFWTNPRFFKDKVDNPNRRQSFKYFQYFRYFPPWHCKLSIDLVVLKKTKDKDSFF